MTTPDEQSLEGDADPLGNSADMGYQGIAGATINLAIAALENARESVVVIDGYLGASDLDVVRLYPAIDISAYVEIPRAAIIYIQVQKSDESAMVRAYVRASSEILSVRCERLRAGDYRQNATPEFPPLQATSREFETCTEKCIATFKTAATQIQIDEISVLRIPDRFRQQAAMVRIEEREEEAKGALYECLSRCFTAHRPPVGVTLAPYYSEVVAEFLERPE